MKQCDVLSSLKSLIRSQLSHDIVDGSFDVGFMQSSNSAVRFRNAEDLAEIWKQLHEGKNITLWCDGMVSKKKGKKHPTSSDSEEEKRQEKKGHSQRRKKVEEVVQGLKAKHGNNAYTHMQFRIWSEMIIGGVHASHDEPLSTTMFLRSGSVNLKKKSSSDVMIQAVDKLVNILKAASSGGNGPAKIIENRSKCYKQLAELKNLKESGVLSNEEYCSENG